MQIRSKKPKNLFIITIALMNLAIGVFVWKTYADLLPIPDTLTPDSCNVRKVQVLDRNNNPLTFTYQNRWNIHDYLPLHDIPLFLQQAFVISEDQRFYAHDGVDWIARLHALWQNIKALYPIRGASTISEQVVRMRHPRPRTMWSRWLEGLEALQLEKKISKIDILEFYLNQVPYTGQRRGVAQASRYYFDRALDTLNHKEMLALVVLVRAPSRMDLHNGAHGINQPIHRLADRLSELKIIDQKQYAQIETTGIQIRKSQLTVYAGHFVHHLYQELPPRYLQTTGRLRTTLDAAVQTKVQTILNHRLKALRKYRVKNGAVLIIDHQSHEVLAWVNGGEEIDGIPGGWIDAVTTPRQPGSTLKPFLYALALEKGWTAATLVDDRPLIEPVGSGLHSYRNYSRIHYGPLVLRDALGNSLNIPAIRTIQFVGVDNFLDCLHDLGFFSLQQHPDFYGDGLALGNGEITLFELVRAYAALADKGIYHPLALLLDDISGQHYFRNIFSPASASLIANILSDPDARQLEFGQGSLLHLPVQTAVKTGTSSDYRDAWAIGFNHRFAVGVWMGNLDHSAMNGITGSKGPALVLRSVFAELNRYRDTRALYLSPRLVKVKVCRNTGLVANDECPSYSEWFIPGTEPKRAETREKAGQPICLTRPTNGLQLAMDPRIPDDREAFLFATSPLPSGSNVDWYIDDILIGTTSVGEYVWPMRRGTHVIRARIWLNNQRHPVATPPVKLTVK
jgi:penicillin-binding protein 1C